MRTGISAYVAQLRKLGAKKIGIYIAHHLYKQFYLNLSEVDAIWIPHYGKNNGQVNSKPSYSCDIHQFTSVGRLDGYNGNLDLNRLMGTKPLEFFTGKEIVKEESKTDKEELDTINVKLHGKDLKVEGICREGTNYIPVRFLERLGYKLDGNNNDVIIEYKEVK